MKQAIQNILRVLLGALTMTALMMAVLFAEAHALPVNKKTKAYAMDKSVAIRHAVRCR